MDLSNFSGLMGKADFLLSRGGLLLQKHSPAIMTGIGIVGSVASTVMACTATLKIDQVMQDSQGEIDHIHEGAAKAKELGKDYSEDDYRMDLVRAYVHRGLRLAKLYGPSIVVGGVSIGCLIGGHNILQKRNVGLIAAYKLVSDTLGDYRKRVEAEVGPEKEREIRSGVKKEEITEKVTGEDGKKEKRKVTKYDYSASSEYAKFFDQFSSCWNPDRSTNVFFLKAQQTFANQRLISKGHLFLNEVYDALGIPRTAQGQIVGWVRDGEGDGYVDFGLDDPNNDKVRAFVNGYESAILLDFNVDGVIYDLI